MTSTTPTRRWLALTAEYMPALDGPAGAAERLALLLHYGIDWTNGWVTNRRARYWDQILPERVQAATFTSPNLHRWWTTVAVELQSQPRNTEERHELAALLDSDQHHSVLGVLRFETEALLLRTRIVAEAVREASEDPS